MGKIYMGQNIQNMRKIFWVPIFIIEIRKINEKWEHFKNPTVGAV